MTHPESDILKCEVTWDLGCITTNKVSGTDGIPAEFFQILKKGCHESAALNMPAHLENSAVTTGLEKVSFHSNPKKKAMPKNVQTTVQLYSFHMPAR